MILSDPYGGKRVDSWVANIWAASWRSMSRSLQARYCDCDSPGPSNSMALYSGAQKSDSSIVIGFIGPRARWFECSFKHGSQEEFSTRSFLPRDTGNLFSGTNRSLVISVPGHFDLGSFHSQVISSLRHFVFGSFRSRGMSTPGHFGTGSLRGRAVKLPVYKPGGGGVLSSIPGFSSLSDETLNRVPVSVWP